MYKAINEYEFINVMSEEGNGFSRQGAGVLYDMLLEFEESTEESIEFDPVAIRCDYSELSVSDFLNDYGYLINESYGIDINANDMEWYDKEYYINEFLDEEYNGFFRVFKDKNKKTHYIIETAAL